MDARSYADSYAAQVEALEALAGVACDDPGEVAELDDAARAMLAELVDVDTATDADTLAAAAGDALDAHGTDAVGIWLDQALDLEVYGQLTPDGWEPTSYAVLVSFGGPTVRMVVDDGASSVLVDVAWSSDRAQRRVHCPELAARIAELGELRADMAGC